MTTNDSNDKTFSNSEYGSSTTPQSEQAILQRAKVHGIETLQQLAYEADIGRVRQKGQRLIETPSARKDLDLWAIILDYRQLKHGAAGIRDVLDEMLYGDEQLKLDMDVVSRHIWHTVLPVVLDDEALLHQLCQVGSSMIRNRPHVFIDVVSQLLTVGNTRLAIVAATQLLISHYRGREDLLELFDIVLQTKSLDAIPAFCQLVSRLPLHRIYSHVIPKLWEAARTRDAFLVHRHLLSLGDLPTRFEQLEPFVREIASRDLKIEPFILHLESSGSSYTHQARRLYAQEIARLAFESNKSAKFVLNQGPGMRPVKLSDTFVARTFATRNVSFDFIINGLRFVGLFEMGPLAVREIALAAENVDVLKERFRTIANMQVDLGSSNYVRVIRNLCLSGQNTILQAVLDSDMHYEEFEDVQKQKRLLVEYYQAKNWPETNRTLAILNGGQTDRDASLRSATLLLQSALVLGDWRGALIELDKLRCSGIDWQAELAPLRFASNRIWADADSEQRESTDYISRYEYLAGFMQLAQAAGLRAHPWQWRTVLYAAGRSGDWNLFESLTLSVARMFAEQTSNKLSSGQDDAKTDILKSLFDNSMKASIIEFGLTADNGDDDPAYLWTRGVDLLDNLYRHFNLDVDYDNLVAAFRSRLEELFNDSDLGVRRRFVTSYLRYLTWAWRQIEIRSKRTPSHSLFQRGWVQPDANSLRLFRLRAKLVGERRESLEPETVESSYLRRFENAAVVKMKTAKQDQSLAEVNLNEQTYRPSEKSKEDTAVFYEDLLHPSYAQQKK